MFNFFKRKAKVDEVANVKPKTIYLDANLDAYRVGDYDLISLFYQSLDEDSKGVITDILIAATGKNFEGNRLDDVVYSLNEKELSALQKLIESEYKIIKH